MDAAEWDEVAAGWDEDEAVQAYAAAAFASLRELCASSGVALEGARILDFGCGTGLLVERLAPLARSVVAVDASAAMLAAVEAKCAGGGLANVEPIHAVLTPEAVAAEPRLAEPFDVITCSSVCAFVDDYPATVSLLAGRLRAGGLFVQWDWELDPAADEPFGLTAAAIRSALTGAELEVLRVETGFDVPIGEMHMRPLMGVGRRGRG